MGLAKSRQQDAAGLLALARVIQGRDNAPDEGDIAPRNLNFNT